MRYVSDLVPFSHTLPFPSNLATDVGPAPTEAKAKAATTTHVGGGASSIRGSTIGVFPPPSPSPSRALASSLPRASVRGSHGIRHFFLGSLRDSSERKRYP
jgi:hypothetical protein